MYHSTYNSSDRKGRKVKGIIILAFAIVLCASILRLVFPVGSKSSVDLSEIPAYSGQPYVELNGNVPSFTEKEKTTLAFEEYGELDKLGRCTYAYANLCPELMPTEKRKSIYSVKPTGWHSTKYPFVDQESLYNRCHLIAFMLAGENDNERNLITGTRYMNTEGMLPFEKRVCEYIELTGHHVLYRVIPVFRGNNLVASGVEMEALSIEDGGENICFHVFVYNVQPGIVIDYRSGDSAIE